MHSRHRSLPRSTKSFGAALASFVLALTASPVVGQTFLPDPVDDAALAVQWEKPFLPGTEGLAAYSSNLEVDGLFPLRPGLTLQVGVPLAFAGADGLDGNSVYMGNLRATLLFGEPGELSSFLGITLPTADNIGGPELALLVGALPWVGELEKWVSDATSLRGAVLPSWPLSSGGRLGLQLGGSAVASNDFENLNIFARAGGWGRVPAGRAELRAELSTSYSLIDDDGFDEQFTSYMELGAGLPDASGRPGLFIRVPLDGDARQVLDLSIGLSFQF